MLTNVDKIFADLDSEQKEYARLTNTLPPMMPNVDLQTEFNIRSTVLEVLERNTIVPVDVRVDDRDIQAAPNFFTFATGSQFLNSTPFTPQAMVATQAFAEWCPHCSDADFIREFPVDATLNEFQRKVCLLEEGVCPSCGSRKSQLVENEDLNFYQEMAVNAGQRCLTGDTLVLTEHGIIEIGKLGSTIGFTDMSLGVHNGTYMEQTSKFFVAAPERVHTIETLSGHKLSGTKDHPVWTQVGFKRMEDITEDDYTKITFGQQVFGNASINMRKMSRAADAEYERKANHISVKTSICPIEVDEDFCSVLGLWVAEGRGHKIYNRDSYVLDFVHDQLERVFPGYVEDEFNGGDVVGLRVRGQRGSIMLRRLVGQPLYSGSAKKRVPSSILKGSKSYQVGFLRGLFEGDGSVVQDRYIEYTTISRRLADHVVAMMLNLGIIVRRRTKTALATNGSDKQVSKVAHVLTVDGDYLEVFQDTVGFLTDRKSNSLSSACVSHRARTKEMSFDYDKLPPQIKYEFLEFVDQVKRPFSTFLAESDYLLETNRTIGRSNRKFVFNVVFGYGQESGLRQSNGEVHNGLYDQIERLRSSNVPLTFKELELYISEIEKSTEFLSPAQSSSLSYFKSFLEPNVFWTRVRSNTLSEKEHTTYDFTLPETHRFWSNGFISHNSGKSAITAMMSAYLIHRLIKLQNPNSVYGILSNSVLHGTFVALTYAQAKDTLWEPLYGYLQETPWFQEYHDLLKHYGEKYGEDLVKLNDTFVLYRHRRLLCTPSGPDKRTLRGRCLVGGTLVNTNHGYVHFEEMVGKRGQHSVSGVTIDGPKGRRPVSHTYKDRSGTIKLRTKNGFTETGTPEHPMLVLTEDLRYVWRRLDGIKVGDWIVSRTANTDPMSGCSEVPVDAATILGYMVANGYRNEISSDDYLVVDRLYKCFHSLTGKYPTTVQGERGVRSATHHLSTDSRGAGYSFTRDYLGSLGYSANTSKDKEIPLSVRTAPSHVLHEFLEAYFECDSGINGGSTMGTPSEVEVGSASKKLAVQLHVILLHEYNILGRLTKRVVYDKLDGATGEFNAKRAHYLVTITGGDAYRFIQTFKRAKVQKYADRIKQVPDGYCSDRRNVPHIRKFLWDMYKEARLTDTSGKKLRRLRLGDGSTVLNSVKPRCFDSIKGDNPKLPDTPEFLLYEDDWDTLLPRITAIDPEKGKRVERLLSLGAHYEQVVEVKDAGIKTVYDVTVPDGHSFTANGLASHNTRFIGSVDELGWFDNSPESKKVKMGATEVYTALERSLLTVRASANKLLRQGFDHIPTGMFLNISSPSSRRDKIMELVRKSQGSRKIYGLSRPTWEMNPTITREDLAEEFRINPTAAMRDYGAEPPLSANPFIESKDMVTEAYRKVKNKLRIKYKRRKSKDGTYKRYAEIVESGRNRKPAVMAIDAGYSSNSFACVVAKIAKGPTLVVDVFAEIIPLPSIPLHYTLIYNEIMSPLIERFNVKVLAADRWNSLKILSDAEVDHDILTLQHSVKYSAFWDFKQKLEEGSFVFPRPEEKDVDAILEHDPDKYPVIFEGRPADHFVLQALTVQDSGTSVLKGDGGLTDDLFRATVLASDLMERDDVIEILLQDAEEEPMTEDKKRSLGTFRSYGGGSGGGSGMSSPGIGTIRRRR
jgi:intein/homing endonuclease